MKTFYFLFPTKGGYSCHPRRCFESEAEGRKVMAEYENSGVEPKLEKRTLEKGEHFWAVFISDYSFVNDDDAIYCKARSVSEAKRQGQEYIRRWDISDQRIQKIKQII